MRHDEGSSPITRLQTECENMSSVLARAMSVNEQIAANTVEAEQVQQDLVAQLEDELELVSPAPLSIQLQSCQHCCHNVHIV